MQCVHTCTSMAELTKRVSSTRNTTSPSQAFAMTASDFKIHLLDEENGTHTVYTSKKQLPDWWPKEVWEREVWY